MKTVLFRTGSGSIPLVSRLPRVPVSVREFSGVVLNNGEKKECSSSPRNISLNLKVNRRSIRRSSSETDVILSEIERSGVSKTLSKLESMSFPVPIPEENCDNNEHDEEVVLRRIGSLSLTEDRRSYAGEWPQSGISIDEIGFPGGGIGKHRKFGGGGGGGDFEAGNFTGGNSDPRKIRAYYEEMLKLDPNNSLLLRNYAKYLHEVERDLVKAEEYYGRSILTNPGDGEVLSLYGKLIWETQRDENRAKSYFDQAVLASPDDCTVLGSYAQFMWEAGEDEDEDEEAKRDTVAVMVEAF